MAGRVERARADRCFTVYCLPFAVCWRFLYTSNVVDSATMPPKKLAIEATLKPFASLATQSFLKTSQRAAITRPIVVQSVSDDILERIAERRAGNAG